MTCQCSVCKYHRKEITARELKEFLEKQVVDFDKILADKTSSKNDLWCADISKEEAEYMLYELKQESK
jgi:arsenate reductase-like glutaredoxin family protein